MVPDTSSFASPLQYRRNQDLDISSIIELNCNLSSQTITQWTIWACTTNCSVQLALDASVITTSAELFIPARTLAYGMYELRLNVTMAAVVRQYTSMASVYVTITPSVLTVNPVQYGTSMVTRGHDQNLTLDPGSFSVDPDTDTFNPTVSPATRGTRECMDDVSLLLRNGSISTSAESTANTTFREFWAT